MEVKKRIFKYYFLTSIKPNGRCVMKNQFSLREIAEWNKEDSEVKIPELQRGLVWSPK